MKKILIALLLGTALFMSGCTKDEPLPQSTVFEGGEVLGEGETEFAFSVTGMNGETKSFAIRTDKKTVGEALIDVDMISGEKGPYGLYVKSVNGEVVDFDKDGKYWAFYIDGEYATSGVEKTPIEEGKTYSLRVE